MNLPASDAPVIRALADVPLVGILRASTAERFATVTDVLVEAGFRAVEYTFTTPNVLAEIEAYVARKPEHVAVGAGTVLTVDEARRAVDAGATFLISPSVDPEVIAEAGRLGVPAVPGAFSPTEIHRAWQAGATAVKVFPAGVIGPRYLKAVRGPFPDIPLLPTGDIEIDDVAGFLAAGAVAVGLGGPLIGDAAEPGGDLDALAARAKAAIAAVSVRTGGAGAS